MKYIVSARPAGYSDEITQEISISDFENEVGKLIVTDRNTIAAHIVLLPKELAEKIEETELILVPDVYMENVLSGKATLKGKKDKQKAGIKTEGRPAYYDLLKAVHTAKQQVSDTRNAIFEAAKPPEPIIPDGMVKVRFSHSKADGWIRVYRDEAGNEFDSPALMGEESGVAWMTQEEYANALQKIETEKVEKVEKVEKAEKNRRRLHHIIEKGDKLRTRGMLLSYAEQEEKAREYDNAYNEGGDGYNPYRDEISLEEYNNAITQYRLGGTAHGRQR